MEYFLKALGVDRLGVNERMRLVEEIWDSIADESDPLDVPQSHKDEIDRRLAAYERGGDDLIRAVESVLKRIESSPEISAIVHRGVLDDEWRDAPQVTIPLRVRGREPGLSAPRRDWPRPVR